MSRSQDPVTNDKVSGGPKNIKAETARVKTPKEITETYLHNSGLYYLQRFAASTGHFRTVMQRKIDRSCHHHPDQNRADCIAMLDRLIQKFQDIGLLNDDGYLRGMVNSLRQRGLSERAIIMRLQNRGLPENKIREALLTFNRENGKSAEETELSAALRLAKKKRLGPYARDAEPNTEKTIAAFARAGFSYGVAKRVLDMDPDSIDDPAGR